MPKRDVVLLGASAGGVEALRELVSGLPPDFPAAMLVVLHVPAGGSALPQILSRSGPLPARHAEEGDPLRPGTILVAPPDHHLVVFDDAVTLSRGPRENGHRPAVDVLFRSAAHVLGPRVVAVVLSGSLDDGAAGMVAVTLRGGVGMVQDPDEALHPSMPSAAMHAAVVDDVLPARKMPHRLNELVREDFDGDGPGTSDLMEQETAMARFDPETIHANDPPGTSSGLSCPDCHGILFEIAEGGLLRYRCRVGHAWSVASLVAQQAAGMESALWIALRSLEEKAALARDLSKRAAARGHALTAATFERQAAEAVEAAGQVHDLIEQVTSGVDLNPAESTLEEGG
jgi:two-component system chemotaxis response regulator CheB